MKARQKIKFLNDLNNRLNGEEANRFSDLIRITEQEIKDIDKRNISDLIFNNID